VEAVVQKSAKENSAAAFKNLLNLLSINYTNEKITSLTNSADYPSLKSLSDSLEELNCQNLAVKLSLHQLKEIPFPAIAHLSKNNGHFVVLQKLKGEFLQYIDPEIGIVKESLQNFEMKWTGVILLAQANKKSGEENYQQKRRQEIFQKVSLFTVGVLAILLVILPLPFVPFSLVSIYLLKIIGGLLCYFLLQKQFGGSNVAIDVFCKMGSKSDCDSVINSSASKIFGIVNLSEIGFWYFVGGLLSMMIGAFASNYSSGILLILSISVLPFSLLAVYYQGWVIKKWCPLCLAVMSIFWAEFITHLMIGDPFTIAWNSLLIAFVGFSLPLVFWLSVRQQFLDSFKLLKMERNLNRFLRSERVFQKLLDDQPEIEMGNFSNELQAGVGKAPISITIVSNPVCGPCSYAHAVIEDLLERFDGSLGVVFRFAINPSDTKSESYEMLSHLMALRLSYSTEKYIEALSSWYLKNGKSNMKKWKEDNPISMMQNQDTINSMIMEHTRWCAMSGIHATPTILINGKKMPEEFSVADLKYQIRKILEKINEPEPTS
jgi:uncharacterized membrane protein/predicted double-glycine peptidase